MSDIVERLRGIYRVPITDGLGKVESNLEPDNDQEFVRQFPSPPIQLEAADEIERLRTGIKRLSDEEERCSETTGDDPFSLVYLAAKLAAAENRISDLIAERDNLSSIVASGIDDVAGAALDDAEETIQRLMDAPPPQQREV